MYKFLPILLLAFLFSEENSISRIIQSDSLDYIWAQSKLDEYSDKFIGDVLNIIDKDKLLIDLENKIIDIVKSEEEVLKNDDNLIEEITDKSIIYN